MAGLNRRAGYAIVSTAKRHTIQVGPYIGVRQSKDLFRGLTARRLINRGQQPEDIYIFSILLKNTKDPTKFGVKLFQGTSFSV